MSYKVGDLVIQRDGTVGIVIGKAIWYEGGPEMIVVLSEGKQKTWYPEYVRLANEKDRLSKSKERPQE